MIKTYVKLSYLKAFNRKTSIYHNDVTHYEYLSYSESDQCKLFSPLNREQVSGVSCFFFFSLLFQLVIYL